VNLATEKGKKLEIGYKTFSSRRGRRKVFVFFLVFGGKESKEA
jgi:hypothetical protein